MDLLRFPIMIEQLKIDADLLISNAWVRLTNPVSALGIEPRPISILAV